MKSNSSAAEKIGELLAREGLLSREQLARSIEAQQQDYSSVPLWQSLRCPRFRVSHSHR
jgi:hypothetical protein